MLHQLIAFSLRFRPVVLILAVVLLVMGGLAYRDAPRDVFPDFAPRQVVVQTEAPGLTTVQVERLVTVPVESALNGVSRLKILRSSSAVGLSVVTAIFEDGTDVLQARQLVTERLQQLQRELPTGTGPPRMTPLASTTGRLVMIGLTSKKVSPIDLRTLADWTFKRRLQAVPGVAHVEVFGGGVKQYQVLLDPEKLQKYHISLEEVKMAASKATGFGGASFVETPNQRLPVQLQTAIETANDIAAAPVAREKGGVISLDKIADVKIGASDKVGDATINDEAGVLIIVHRQPSVNTLTVTQHVEQAVDELSAALPEGVTLHKRLFRQATFIERSMANLQLAILIGCILVCLVLVGFLNDWRTAIITLTAIPLSVMGAILLLRLFDLSLNVMTLGGLAIALGEVVDDAIVDVENVFQRLRENARLPEPKPAFGVVLHASLEVRSAVVYASFIVVSVFLPVFFLQGLAGTFFRPLGYAYVAAILASLITALTVTPALCLLLFPKVKRTDTPPRDSLLVRGLKWLYLHIAPLFLRLRWLTLAATVVLLAGAASVVPYMGGEFLPEFRESNFVIHMVGPADSSLVETVRANRHLARELRKIEGVMTVAGQIGRADLSEDTWGVNYSEVWIAIEDSADHDAVVHEIRETLEKFPGQAAQVKQFLRERIDEVLTGTTADIVIRVVGPELPQLRKQAAKIAGTINKIDGVGDLKIEQQVDVPQVEIQIPPRKALQYQLSAGDVLTDVQTLLKGSRVGQVYEKDRVFDVIVRAHPHARDYPEELNRLLIDTPPGDRIPLGAVTTLRLTEAANQINREQASRRLLITCNAVGRDVAGVMQDIRSRLQPIADGLPSSYYLEYGGEYEERAAAQERLLVLGCVAVAAIFMLLYLDFRSIRLALLVMFSLPFAAVGGIVAVILTGGDISLGSLVGFVTVLGIAARNGILLISRYEHLRHEENVPFGREMILRGAVERLAPILMTATTTGLALLPLVIRGNIPGHEIEHPMAVVILGGLISSTALTLIVLPVLYEWLGRHIQRTAVE